MSFLISERLPVKVYKWNDVGAPALDKTAGSMMAIFKACLVTGYGTKESAGWTMPYEDTTAKVKIFRPKVSPYPDFYLRLSADTGTEVKTQIHLNMTDVNTGDLRLECATPFKYAKQSSSGKWLLVASERGLWFLCEQYYTGNANGFGAYFFAGDALQYNTNSIDRVLYLQHTGGTENTGDYSTILGRYSPNYDIISAGNFLYGKVTDKELVAAGDVRLTFIFDGMSKVTDELHTMPAIFIKNKILHRLPGLFLASNGVTKVNFDTVAINQSSGGVNSIVFGFGGGAPSNFYVATDYWEY